VVAVVVWMVFDMPLVEDAVHKMLCKCDWMAVVVEVVLHKMV